MSPICSPAAPFAECCCLFPDAGQTGATVLYRDAQWLVVQHFAGNAVKTCQEIALVTLDETADPESLHATELATDFVGEPLWLIDVRTFDELGGYSGKSSHCVAGRPSAASRLARLFADVRIAAEICGMANHLAAEMEDLPTLQTRPTPPGNNGPACQQSRPSVKYSLTFIRRNRERRRTNDLTHESVTWRNPQHTWAFPIAARLT